MPGAMSDAAHIPVIHDSPEWHEIRARHIGGSEIASLWDLPPGERPGYLTSRFALWHIKAGNAPPPRIDNPRTQWGLRLEAAIADGAAEKEGWEIVKGGYVSDPTTRGLGATLDFVILSDPAEDGPGVLEVKNVSWLVHKKSWGGEPPFHILLQHQHQFAASGYTWGAVAALVDHNDLRVYRYRARPRLIAEIRARVTAFWASIDDGREPPVDGSDSASDVLRSLYPEVIDDAVDMRTCNEWAEAAEALHGAAEARRGANDEYDAAKNRIIRLLDGHRRGWGNGWAVNTTIIPENSGREPKPGERIGAKKEVRKYSAKEMGT